MVKQASTPAFLYCLDWKVEILQAAARSRSEVDIHGEEIAGCGICVKLLNEEPSDEVENHERKGRDHGISIGRVGEEPRFNNRTVEEHGLNDPEIDIG